MLDIALGELARRSAQQMFSRQLRPRRNERHAVLQLIAEAIGSAGLVEPGSRPDATTQRLIKQPAVEHDVHGPNRRLDDDGAQCFLPMARDLGLNRIEIGGTVFLNQTPRFIGARRLAEEKHDLDCDPRRDLNLPAHGCAGIETGARILRPFRVVGQSEGIGE